MNYVQATKMEDAWYKTYTAASNQGAIKMLWLLTVSNKPGKKSELLA